MYQLDKSILTLDRSRLIQNLINVHETEFRPRYEKLLRYYNGDHDQIKLKKANKFKVNNQIVNPFPALIVNTVQGYLLGQPVQYVSDDQEALDSIKDILYSNDEDDSNSEILKTMSICGEAFEYVYINEDSEIEFVQLDPTETIVVYDNSLKPKIMLALRYYDTVDFNNHKTRYAELYTENTIEYYSSNNGTRFELQETYEHGFGQVPVIHYRNNEEETGDFEKALSEIDDYDNKISMDADEIEQFRNAYMVAKGVGKIDKNFMRDVNQTGIFCIPNGNNNSDMGIDFITKNINTDATQNHLQRIEDNIHKFSQVPNFTDPKANTADTGIAIQLKTWGFEQMMGAKERKLQKGLFARLRLIMTALYRLGSPLYDANEFSIKFTRNLPTNVKEDVQDLKLLGISYSDLSEDALKDVLANITIIEDAQEAAKTMKADAEKKQNEAQKQLEANIQNTSDNDMNDNPDDEEDN